MTDQAQADREAEERDRRLALALRWGLPATTILGFLAMFGLTSLGPALLVLAAGGLLGAIALLWTSLRSLFGDVAIDEELDEAAAAARSHTSSRATERKRVALRALKDLEHEHAVGKIDDEDYFRLTARYREDAKAALRELDDQVAEYRPQAEALVAKHLARSSAKAKAREAEEEAKPARVPCPKCGVKNDPDARFCKKCGAGMKAKKKTEAAGKKTKKEREREEEVEELVAPAKAVAEEDAHAHEDEDEDEDEEETDEDEDA